MAALFYAVALGLFACILVHGAAIVKTSQGNFYKNQDGNVVCFNYTCPTGTVACEVREKNNALNATIVDVTRSCFSIVGNLTGQSNYTFTDKNSKFYNSYIYYGADVIVDGRNDPQIALNISKADKKVFNEMQRDLNSTIEKIKKEMANIEKWF